MSSTDPTRDGSDPIDSVAPSGDNFSDRRQINFAQLSLVPLVDVQLRSMATRYQTTHDVRTFSRSSDGWCCLFRRTICTVCILLMRSINTIFCSLTTRCSSKPQTVISEQIRFLMITLCSFYIQLWQQELKRLRYRRKIIANTFPRSRRCIRSIRWLITVSDLFLFFIFFLHSDSHQLMNFTSLSHISPSAVDTPRLAEGPVVCDVMLPADRPMNWSQRCRVEAKWWKSQRIVWFCFCRTIVVCEDLTLCQLAPCLYLACD